MNTRTLLRSDLPKSRKSGNSLHIPVIYKGQERIVCDIFYLNDLLCYLEGNKGVPVKIKDCSLILKDKTDKLFLKVMINRNNLSDLKTITKLVREGWDIIHFDLCDEEKDKDTKVVLIC